MNQDIENIIKTNLPERKICNGDDYLKKEGFNQALSQIPVSLIADEVLKVVVEKIREMVENLSDEYDRGYDEKTSQPALLNKLLQELSNLSPNKENKNNG